MFEKPRAEMQRGPTWLPITLQQPPFWIAPRYPKRCLPTKRKPVERLGTLLGRHRVVVDPRAHRQHPARALGVAAQQPLDRRAPRRRDGAGRRHWWRRCRRGAVPAAAVANSTAAAAAAAMVAVGEADEACTELAAQPLDLVDWQVLLFVNDSGGGDRSALMLGGVSLLL